MAYDLNRVIQVIEDGLSEGIFPGIVILIKRRGRVVLYEAFGYAEQVPKERSMEKTMIFDLASLTKVMATLPAVLRTVEQGKLGLEDPVSRYVPGWLSKNQATGDEVHAQKAAVTIHHLLIHTSGLPAWRPYYLVARSGEAYEALIAAEPLAHAPGARVVYSDLGFILLGRILERIWDRPLDEVARLLVFDPLDLKDTGYRRLSLLRACAAGDSQVGDGEAGDDEAGAVPFLQRPRSQFVATERMNGYERQAAESFVAQFPQESSMTAQGAGGGQSDIRFCPTLDDVARLPWRTGTICGEVHDGNAYYGLHGVSGHAGLFSTAQDVAAYLSMWRDRGRVGRRNFLSESIVRYATQNHTAHLNSARALGFEAAPTQGTPAWEGGCSAGTAASSGAFGHTGFTGTSMWYDPHTDTEVVALTNRVHPYPREGIVPWRRKLHAAAFGK